MLCCLEGCRALRALWWTENSAVAEAESLGSISSVSSACESWSSYSSCESESASDPDCEVSILIVLLFRGEGRAEC